MVDPSSRQPVNGPFGGEQPPRQAPRQAASEGNAVKRGETPRLSLIKAREGFAGMPYL
jgi:hypothetical protein